MKRIIVLLLFLVACQPTDIVQQTRTHSYVDIPDKNGTYSRIYFEAITEPGIEDTKILNSIVEDKLTQLLRLKDINEIDIYYLSTYQRNGFGVTYITIDSLISNWMISPTSHIRVRSNKDSTFIETK